MGYQALLFCPDEKLANVVSQVFSELDFSVEAVHEPFAAVKKLMAQRYDAIVVDSQDEQSASLLFKSARNSSSNQASLAIALVEGQAGVAKAYRIGANLVLTKPINVEQAKGTLRVARGLLRKHSDAANAPATNPAAPVLPSRAVPVSAGSSFQPPSRDAATATHSEIPDIETAPPAMIPEAMPTEFPETTASSQIETKPAVIPAPAAQAQTTIEAEPSAEAHQPASPALPAANLPARNTTSAFTSVVASAAAPAPAKEAPASPVAFRAKENRIVESEPAEKPASIPIPTPTFTSISAGDVLSYGAGKEAAEGSAGNKKLLIAAVIVLALAALGYIGYGRFVKSASTPVPQPVSAPPNSEQHASAPAPSPVSTPSQATPEGPGSANLGVKAPTAAPLAQSPVGTGNSPAIRIAANTTATPDLGTKKPDSAPLQVRSNDAGVKPAVPAEESAPQLSNPPAVASANDNALTGLLSAAPNVLKPSLATVRISQGVSEGLLIKRVQPKYPSAALSLHAQGAVQIEATINKEGFVTNPRVISGAPVLAQAAVAAVRQWRYKPYYLDGQPVEIQTQITVNFKAE